MRTHLVLGGREGQSLQSEASLDRSPKSSRAEAPKGSGERHFLLICPCKRQFSGVRALLVVFPDFTRNKHFAQRLNQPPAGAHLDPPTLRSSPQGAKKRGLQDLGSTASRADFPRWAPAENASMKSLGLDDVDIGRRSTMETPKTLWE